MAALRQLHLLKRLPASIPRRQAPPLLLSSGTTTTTATIMQRAAATAAVSHHSNTSVQWIRPLSSSSSSASTDQSSSQFHGSNGIRPSPARSFSHPSPDFDEVHRRMHLEQMDGSEPEPEKPQEEELSRDEGSFVILMMGLSVAFGLSLANMVLNGSWKMAILILLLLSPR